MRAMVRSLGVISLPCTWLGGVLYVRIGAGRHGPGKESSMCKKIAFTMYPATDISRACSFHKDVLGLAQGSVRSNVRVP